MNNLLLSLTAIVLLTACSGKRESKQEISIAEATTAKTAIVRMIAHDSLDVALLEIIELEPKRSDDAQIPFIKGVILHKSGDEAASRLAFRRALAIYDSLMADAPNIFDAINRATCLLILDGEEAFHDQLDSIEQTKEWKEKSLGNSMHMFRAITKKDLLHIFDKEK